MNDDICVLSCACSLRCNEFRIVFMHVQYPFAGLVITYARSHEPNFQMHTQNMSQKYISIWPLYIVQPFSMTGITSERVCKTKKERPKIEKWYVMRWDGMMVLHMCEVYARGEM
jgi:hypothetical protein